MKKSLILLFTMLTLLFCGCSEDHTANKAMKELGSGKYIDVDGLNFEKIEMFSGSLYSDAEAKNQFAETGEYDLEYEKILINTDMLFSKFEMVSKNEIKVDLYGYLEKPKEGDTYSKEYTYDDDLRGYNMLKEFNRKEYKKIKTYIDTVNNDVETGYSFLRFKDVPMYIFRYKVDYIYLTEMHVIKHPDDGYRVTYFQRVK